MASGTDSPRRRKGRRLGRGLSSLIQIDTPVRVDLPPDEQRNSKQNANIKAAGAEHKAGLEDSPPSDHEAARPDPTRPDPTQGGTIQPGEADAPDIDSDLGLVSIALNQIEPSPFQPRQRMDEITLDRLADSIRRTGLIQPIIVRRVPQHEVSGGAAGYELVAGERRWRAAQRAGLDAIPALVRELGDEQAAEWALVENVQREDLNAIERAWALRRLAERFGLTHGQIGQRVSLDRSSVANLIRLTDLEDQIQAMLAGGALSLGHGKALRAAPAGARRIALAQTAVSERWSVRQLEAQARLLAKAPDAPHPTGEPSTAPTRAAALLDLETQLGEHLGTKVTIRADRSGTKGRLSIAFYDLDHFDGLMSKMGFSIRS